MKVRGLKWFSLGQNQAIGMALFLLGALGENLFACPFQFLEATFIPWLMVPFLQLQSQ